MYCFCVNIHSFWIYRLQQVPKKLGQGYVYHCVTSPFLLKTLSKHLGTEDTNCWSFESRILYHSCLMYDFSCSTVRGLRCCVLHFIMCHTFWMGDRFELQAGQSSTRNLLLRSHAVVTCSECGFAEISRDVPEKDVAWMAAYDAPTPVHQFHHFKMMYCIVQH